jgi:hypothetical protein
MKPEELKEETSIELELMEATVQELLALQQDVTGREPTVREKTAAAAFMAQFYSGVENILKRISRFHSVPLPTGDTWHVDLFKRFCSPPYEPLPALFDEALESALAPYRRFRHVVHHGYGFQLDWNRMKDGIAGVEEVLSKLRERLSEYLQTMEASDSQEV